MKLKINTKNFVGLSIMRSIVSIDTTVNVLVVRREVLFVKKHEGDYEFSFSPAGATVTIDVKKTKFDIVKAFEFGLPMKSDDMAWKGDVPFELPAYYDFDHCRVVQKIGNIISSGVAIRDIEIDWDLLIKQGIVENVD